MTAQIIQFAPPKPKLELSQVIELATDELLEDWNRMVRVNRINEFIRSLLPQSTNSEVNYTSDLNAVSKLELNFGLSPMIYFPGTAYKEQLGWIVQLAYDDQMIRTPELASESSARAFAVLLFLKVRTALNRG